MAKFAGLIGYGETKEIRPGVWQEEITERMYYGDVMQFQRKWESSGNLNDDLNVSNKISILSDPFANENFHSMRYIRFRGAKWKITSVEVQYPRLLLTIGGVYHEEQA